MAADKTQKAAQFITKLLQLTQEKKIEWVAEDSPRKDGRAAFVAELEGKKLKLYREEVDAFGDFAPLMMPRMIERMRLEVLDAGLVTYSFGGASGLRDLYENVAFSASNVDEFMDAVLEKN